MASQSFVSARREWDDRYASLARGKRNWQLTALALLATLFVCTGALAWLSTRSRVVPYVIEVDRDGKTVAVGPAEPLEEIEERFMRYALGLFIHDLRSVMGDPLAQKELVDRAYEHTRGLATAFLHEHFREANPLRRAEGERVSVQVQSILPISETSWQVQWRETVHPMHGRPAQNSSWQTILTVEVEPPTSAETLLQNPLGLYVTEIHWTRTTGGDPS